MSDFDWLGLGDFFGSGSLPPESVARKVLEIGSQPLSKAGIAAAFRFRVKLLRPDLSDDAAEQLRLRDLGEGSRNEASR